MGRTGVLLMYHGRWSLENEYVGYINAGYLLPEDCSFQQLQDIVYAELGKGPAEYKLNLSYKLDNSGSFMKISNELSLQFYLQLKEESKAVDKYPIFVEYTQTRTSASGGLLSNTRLNGNMAHPFTLRHDILEEPPLTELPTNEQLGEELCNIICRNLDNDEDPLIEVVSQMDSNNIIVGKLFVTKQVLSLSLAMHAVINRYEYRVRKSDKSTYYVKCAESKCEWRLRAISVDNTEMFKVTKISGHHVCSFNYLAGLHQNSSRELIAHIIKYKFMRTRTIYTAKDIGTDIKERYLLRLSYLKAWRARERALEMVRGDPSQSYQKLPAYLYRVSQANPNTITNMAIDEENRFKYCFVALGASIEGWKYCRLVIVVDATYLNGVYGGTMFIACTQDGNNRIFILAYGIGDTEDDES